jgi:hypothetical protein
MTVSFPLVVSVLKDSNVIEQGQQNFFEMRNDLKQQGFYRESE